MEVSDGAVDDDGSGGVVYDDDEDEDDGDFDRGVVAVSDGGVDIVNSRMAEDKERRLRCSSFCLQSQPFKSACRERKSSYLCPTLSASDEPWNLERLKTDEEATKRESMLDTCIQT